MVSFNDKVQEILSGLDEDDDFVEAVKNEIDYGEVVADALKNEGTQRTLKKSIVAALKSIFESEEDDAENSIVKAVKGQIDISALVRTALADPEVKDELKKAVFDEVKRAIEENDDWFSDAVSEAVSEAAKEELEQNGFIKNLLKNDEEFKNAFLKTLRDKLLESLENGDIDVDDDILEVVDFSAEAKALLESKCPEFKRAIEDLITKALDNLDELEESDRERIWNGINIEAFMQEMMQDAEFKRSTDAKLRDFINNEVENLVMGQSTQIAKSILDSPAFKAAVDGIIRDLSSSGKIDEFARGIVERSIRDSRQFQSTVLEQVEKALSARVAASIVDTAFGASSTKR